MNKISWALYRLVLLPQGLYKKWGIDTRQLDLLLKTNNLHAWEGYDTYLAYQESGFEVTPSVTLTPTPTGE